jgi:hypothetical protein
MPVFGGELHDSSPIHRWMLSCIGEQRIRSFKRGESLRVNPDQDRHSFRPEVVDDDPSDIGLLRDDEA